MTNNAITVSAKINASLLKCWECWTEPTHVMNWNFASPDWHCPKASNDLRPTGRFSYTMAARDGSMSFDFEGEYERVEPHKFISYTMDDGRQVEILFSADGDLTMVSETFDPESMNPLEMQRAGWQAILDNFKKYTEEN